MLELSAQSVVVDPADSLQILSHGGNHQFQVLLAIRRAGQCGVGGIHRHVGTGAGSHWTFGQNSALMRQCQTHQINSTFSAAANFSNCSIT